MSIIKFDGLISQILTVNFKFDKAQFKVMWTAKLLPGPIAWEEKKIIRTTKPNTKKMTEGKWLLKRVIKWRTNSLNLGFIRCLIVKPIWSNEISKPTIVVQVVQYLIPFDNTCLIKLLLFPSPSPQRKNGKRGNQLWWAYPCAPH